MKYFFAIAVLVLSFNASAQASKKTCSMQDDNILSAALYNGEIREGAEFLPELLDLRSLYADSIEVVVVCNRVMSDELGGSGPLKYEFLGTGVGFEIAISRTERSQYAVSIHKK